MSDFRFRVTASKLGPAGIESRDVSPIVAQVDLPLGWFDRKIPKGAFLGQVLDAAEAVYKKMEEDGWLTQQSNSTNDS